MATPVKYKDLLVAATEYLVSKDMYALYDHDYKLIDTIRREEYLSHPTLKNIGNSNGQYRRTNSQVHRSASGKSGGAGSPGTVTFGTLPTPGGPFITIIPLAIGAAIYGTIHGASHSTIADAGIRAGEITAHRCWWTYNNKLYSIYKIECEWFPNTPMEGEVSHGHGVHGFKNYEYLRDYRSAVLKNLAHPINCSLITGTVAMWGEIVEHEAGYRAQYAKITALDTLNNNLRMKYGV